MALQLKAFIQNLVDTARVATGKWRYTSLESILTDLNDSLAFKTSLKDKTITCFGDSITAANYPGANSYVTQMVNILGGMTVHNYAHASAFIVNGNSGDAGTINNLCGRVDAAITADLATDIIFVHIGSNGTYDTLAGDFNTAMAKTTQGSLDQTLIYEAYRYGIWRLTEHWPNAKVFCVVPPQQNEAWPIGKFFAQAQAIRDIAWNYNCFVIDASRELGIVQQYELPGAMGQYLQDGLHPNSAGETLMANFYAREILKRFL